jgi:hypothetical protein
VRQPNSHQPQRDDAVNAGHQQSKRLWTVGVHGHRHDDSLLCATSKAQVCLLVIAEFDGAEVSIHGDYWY